jgi:hypothetical protein
MQTVEMVAMSEQNVLRFILILILYSLPANGACYVQSQVASEGDGVVMDPNSACPKGIPSGLFVASALAMPHAIDPR